MVTPHTSPVAGSSITKITIGFSSVHEFVTKCCVFIDKPWWMFWDRSHRLRPYISCLSFWLETRRCVWVSVYYTPPEEQVTNVGQLVNRPGVAGAVLQTASSTSLINFPDIINPKLLELGSWNWQTPDLPNSQVKIKRETKIKNEYKSRISRPS